MRKVCYVTGTRADYGLMSLTLKKARDDGRLDVSVCVTGMHLIPEYGETVREIEIDGLRICGRIPVKLDGSSGATMARAIAGELFGIVDVLEDERPDIMVVLGDRGEMLAAAVAAMHLGIPIVHIHGGERSGTVDDAVRHAISKLSHYHAVATCEAEERLVRMGEKREHVFVTGAPGLDDIPERPARERHTLLHESGLDASQKFALVVFHPVVQDAKQAGAQMQELLDALADTGIQALIMRPNADAGGAAIDKRLNSVPEYWRVSAHIPRNEYLSCLAAADVMVGNSSSGIIEAATVGTRVVNVGDRQALRERNSNVTDVSVERDAIRVAALVAGRYQGPNVYGDGHASDRIVRLLAEIPLNTSILKKVHDW